MADKPNIDQLNVTQVADLMTDCMLDLTPEEIANAMTSDISDEWLEEIATRLRTYLDDNTDTPDEAA